MKFKRIKKVLMKRIKTIKSYYKILTIRSFSLSSPFLVPHEINEDLFLLQQTAFPKSKQWGNTNFKKISYIQSKKNETKQK